MKNKVFSTFTRFLLKTNRRAFSKQFDPSCDYYKVIGVQPTATDEEIKKAYRALVKKYHPDVNKNGETKFKEINQANEILSNSEARKEYDSIRTNRNSPKPQNQYNNYGYYSKTQNNQTYNRRSANTNFSSDKNFEDFLNSFYQQNSNSYNQQRSQSGRAKVRTTTRTFTDLKGNKYHYTYNTYESSEPPKSKQYSQNQDFEDIFDSRKKETSQKKGPQKPENDPFENIAETFFNEFKNFGRQFNEKQSFNADQAKKAKEEEEWQRNKESRHFSNFYKQNHSDREKNLSEDLEKVSSQVKDFYKGVRENIEEKGFVKSLVEGFRSFFNSKRK